MKKTFTAATLEEASRAADEWVKKQQGVRVVSRTNFSTSETGPSVTERERCTVTIHYVDLEHVNKALMAALNGIAAGKDHTQSVSVQPFGVTSKISDALDNAVRHLQEPFHAEDIDRVDQAFKRLGLVRSSDRKDEVARALLTHFVPGR
jgi:hypothetical protein